MARELGDGAPVLRRRRVRVLDARQITRKAGEIGGTDLRAEGGHAVRGIKGEKQIVATGDHGGQDRLHQGIRGIDEDVIGLETIEGKHKLDDFKVCGAQ